MFLFLRSSFHPHIKPIIHSRKLRTISMHLQQIMDDAVPNYRCLAPNLFSRSDGADEKRLSMGEKSLRRIRKATPMSIWREQILRIRLRWAASAFRISSVISQISDELSFMAKTNGREFIFLNSSSFISIIKPFSHNHKRHFKARLLNGQGFDILRSISLLWGWGMRWY